MAKRTFNSNEVVLAPHPKIHNFVDMTGIKVAKLTVVGFAKSNGNGAEWWCLCDCGTYTIVSRGSLLSTIRGVPNGTKSCGCSRRSGTGSRPQYSHIVGQTTQQAAKNIALKDYRVGARNRGYSFDLTVEEFHTLVQQNCHYCGAEPAMVKIANSIHRENIPYIHNGIDRKDNCQGYTLANSLPCCSICNHAKKNMSYEEFTAWISRISNYYKGEQL